MREWVDGRFTWLQTRLGEALPRTLPVVCPTPDFFPDPYSGTDEDAHAIFRRVAVYMNVDPQTLQLAFYNRGPEIVRNERGAAGLYAQGGTESDKRPQILVDRSQSENPMSLVATLAHEIGHEILLGGGLVTREDDDHEPLTDLLTVFLGLGIFSANATIHDSGWSRNGWHGWKTARLGYLDQPTYGYALARFAHTRGESKPVWMRHVRPDVRNPLKQSLRFLAI